MREQRVGFVVHVCKLAVGDGKNVGEEGECGGLGLGLERGGGLWLLACLGVGVGRVVEGEDGWEGRVWTCAGSAELLRS